MHYFELVFIYAKMGLMWFHYLAQVVAYASLCCRFSNISTLMFPTVFNTVLKESATYSNKVFCGTLFLYFDISPSMVKYASQ